MTRFSMPHALVLTLLLATTGCHREGPAKPDSVTPVKAASTYATVHPERKPIVRTIEQPATIEAYEETPLLARIVGYVRKVNVDLGDRIKGPRFDSAGKLMEPGQVLAEIAVPEMEEEVRQKKALVAQTEAEVQQAEAAIEVAAANIATAKALVQEAQAGRERAVANLDRWAAEFKQAEKLVLDRVIDAQNLEITRNQQKAAAAALKEVDAKVVSAQAITAESAAKHAKAKADHAAAKARVQVAQADEGRAAALLDYSKIRAPFDGVITSRTVHTGHYLSGAGVKPLFVAARTDVMRVLIEVPEADAGFISVGVPARIRCQVIKDQEFEGKVTRISWALEAKARTLRAEVDLANAGGKLRPGMYAYVAFRAEATGGFTLPAAAVTTHADQPCVYQVENGKAVCTFVKVGVRGGPVVQVLKKQIKSGGKSGTPAPWEDFTGQESIAVGNVSALADGQPIMAEMRLKN